MNSKSSKSLEVLNKENVKFIQGGLAADSKRWDSQTKDSKKHDDYTKLDSASSAL